MIRSFKVILWVEVDSAGLTKAEVIKIKPVVEPEDDGEGTDTQFKEQ